MPANDHHVAQDPWRGVHNAIRDSIIKGEYPPGTRLVEQQLADRFGTSRGPVRTALQQLERSGLVESLDRRGTFVRAVTAEDAEEILSLWDLLWRFALRRAATRIGPEERQWLERFRDQGPPEDDEDLFERSEELGRAVFRMAAHRRALEVYDSLFVQAQARSLFVIAEGTFPVEHAQADFAPLIDALLEGDAEQAIAASESWLGSSRRYWGERYVEDVVSPEWSGTPASG
jgi:DNA-binding GntR family transcriptional regulator